MKVEAVQYFLYGIAIDEVIIHNAFNLMFLSLIADDFNYFQEQRNEL